MTHLNPPPESRLVNLLVSPAERQRIRDDSISRPSFVLDPRQLCDLDQLLSGGFSPLEGFMNRADYESVLERMRLADGTIWPIPVTLSLPKEKWDEFAGENRIMLRDAEGALFAAMEVLEAWEPDVRLEAEAVYGGFHPEHPGIMNLMEREGEVYIAGKIEGIQLPQHYDFKKLRHTPAQLRSIFQQYGWPKIAGYHTDRPIHRAQKETSQHAAVENGAHLLVHPVVGVTQPGALDHYTRARCYTSLAPYYPAGLMTVSLLNLAMRMAGPREALWHAIIRKNYGCTHFIVEPHHAEAGGNSQLQPLHEPFDAQRLVAEHESKTGISMIPYEEMAYLPRRGAYAPVKDLPPGEPREEISEEELRRRLSEGIELPDWFSFPEVIRELRKAIPSKDKQGFTLFFTGLSGAGKSTVARIMYARLMELGDRPVTLLDGDIVRTHLSSQLGFSKEHRDLNILRIGFVANEITKNCGIAICAPIAPYEETRKKVRELISAHGGFIEIHVATPLEVCERRDRKGLYAKARAGLIKGFTGIDDPYQTPKDPEFVLDTTDVNPEESVEALWIFLEKQGYLR